MTQRDRIGSKLAKLAACAALITLPAPAFSSVPDVTHVAANAQAMSNDCVKHKIIGANSGVTQVNFYDQNNKVIESRKDHLGRNEVNIPILGCDATWFFVMAPHGDKAKVRRIDVTVDGMCKPALVTDATPVNHSTTGFGGC